MMLECFFFVAGKIFADVGGCHLVGAMYCTFYPSGGSSISVIFRGRGISIYSVKLQCHFSWQAQYFLKLQHVGM